MSRLAPDLPDAYAEKLRQLKSMGAVVMVLALDRQLTKGIYWHNLPKPAGFPFLAMVEHTNYMDPSRTPFMINYRVDDLDGLLEALRAEGVEIDPKREDYDYGRFAWITDPEGNKIELWEPPPGRDALLP